jgi:hypothetical protein
VNARQAAELRGLLSAACPQAEIEVTPSGDGARVVSPLLRQLLNGSVT